MIGRILLNGTALVEGATTSKERLVVVNSLALGLPSFIVYSGLAHPLENADYLCLARSARMQPRTPQELDALAELDSRLTPLANRARSHFQQSTWSRYTYAQAV